MELIKQFPIQARKEWRPFFKGSNPFRRYTCLHEGKILVRSDSPYHKNIYSSFLPKIRGKVLILGIGVGVLNSMIKDSQCQEITCIDPDPYAFTLAKKYLAEKPHKEYEQIIGDGNNLRDIRGKLKGRRFDVIVWDLIGHSYRPIYSQFVAYKGSILRWDAK